MRVTGSSGTVPVPLLFHDVYVRDPHESGFVSPAADRYKLSLEEFDAQLAGLAHTEGGDGFLITVDDGGVSYFTVVADRLEGRGWLGHCFVTTSFIGARGFMNRSQLRELHARGHVIGSHSVTHPARFSALSCDEMRREWADSRRMLEDVLGAEMTTASVPGGYYSRQVAEAAAEAGIRLLFNSEPRRRRATARIPQTEVRNATVDIVGRFTIRHGDPPDTGQRLVSPRPWARCRAWASWNAKGLVKPLLGDSYARIANWVIAR